MMARIISGVFIVGFASQLSALERVGQEHALKFTKDDKIVVNIGRADIPINVTEIKSEIDGLNIKLEKITFDMQHTNDTTYTCTLNNKQLALAIMFNTKNDCEIK